MTIDSNSPQRPRLLKVAEAAAILRESKYTTYRRISSGQLAAVRIGATKNAPLRVNERALNKLLQPTAKEA